MTVVLIMAGWVAVSALMAGAFMFGSAIGRRRGYREALDDVVKAANQHGNDLVICLPDLADLQAEHPSAQSAAR